MSVPAYSVTLHHLAPGAKAAGLAYPDEQLAAVTVPQLRDLLFALSAVASHLTIYEPSTPEIRIKTERDVFIVRTRYRRLCFVGWETILRGEDHSVSFILTTITGTAEPAKAPPKPERTGSTSPTGGSASPTGHSLSNPPLSAAGGMPRWAKVAVLGALIVAFNGATAWMLLRPPPSLLPQHELLSESESRALLIRAAGQYETGTAEGDRRLIVDTEGRLRLGKFNAQHAVVEERTKPLRGAMVQGRAALITGDTVLTIKDADTVVLYNTTYRRHGR